MKKTVKSMALLALISILLFLLTGCANVNYEIKLEKDGSGDVCYIIGYDKKFLTSMGVSGETLKEDDTFNEMKQEAQQDGYTVEIYEDSETYGFKAYKHVANIQEEFKIEGQENPEEDGIKFEKSFLKTKFSQNAQLNLSQVMEEETDALTNAVLAQMKIKYKITLPYKVGENNATTVSEDGKTIEWTLNAGQTNEIRFEASEDYTMYIAMIAGIVVIVLIGGAVIFSLSKKKKMETKKAPMAKVETKKEKTVEKSHVKKEETKKVEQPKTEEIKKQETVKVDKETKSEEDTTKKKETKTEEEKEEPKKEE